MNLLITLLLVKFSYAGGSGSHGGNASVCFSDPKIVADIMIMPEDERYIPNEYIQYVTDVMPLDLYEATTAATSLEGTNSEAKLISVKEGETRIQFLKRLGERFKTSVPEVELMINEGIQAFTGKTRFHSDKKGMAGISQVFDVGQVPYKIDRSYCVIATVARQQGINETLQLDLDYRLLEKMGSDLNRNVIFLHELVFYWGRKNAPYTVTSFQVRKIVAALLQSEMNRSELIDLLRIYRFYSYGDFDGEKLYYENQLSLRLQNYFKIARSEALKVSDYKTYWDVRYIRVSYYQGLVNLYTKGVQENAPKIASLEKLLKKTKSKRKKSEIQFEINLYRGLEEPDSCFNRRTHIYRGKCYSHTDKSYEDLLSQYTKLLKVELENLKTRSDLNEIKLKVSNSITQFYESVIRPELESISDSGCWKNKEEYLRFRTSIENETLNEDVFFVEASYPRYRFNHYCDDFVVRETKD